MSRGARTPSAIGTLIGLCALALLLRVLGPLDSGLWYDEIWTLVDFARMPFGQLITTFGSDNNHPLYSVLAWLSLHALGESAFALRLPALVFGVLSVGMLYLYARRVTTPREAVIAALLLATSYHHVWFSQNARGYTLLLFFTLASTHYFEDLLDGRSRRALVPYAATLALGTYAHLSGIVVALAHFAVYLHAIYYARGPNARHASMNRRAWLWPLWGMLLAGAVSLMLHAFLLSEMLAFFTQPGGEDGPVVESEWRSPWWTIRAVATSLGFGLLPGLLLLGSSLIVLGAGALSYAKQSARRILLFVLPGVFTASVLLLLERNLWPRFFFFQAGFILLIAVRGLSLLAAQLSRWVAAAQRERVERSLFVAGIAGLALAWLSILPRAYLVPKQDFEGAQRFVQEVRRPGEVVLTTGLTVLPYARYYPSDFVPVESVEQLDAALRGHSAAYVLYTLPTFTRSSAPELAQVLAQRGEELQRLPGSVGDGDVVVLRVRPSSSHGKE